jgi:hypothetical protein
MMGGSRRVNKFSILKTIKSITKETVYEKPVPPDCNSKFLDLFYRSAVSSRFTCNRKSTCLSNFTNCSSPRRPVQTGDAAAKHYRRLDENCPHAILPLLSMDDLAI